MTIMASKSVAIGIFRRDLRVADNPLLHYAVTQADPKPDFFLPLYVFQANQYEVSGFIQDGSPSPYKPARSQVGGFNRCGRYRAEFVGHAVSDLKQSLESLGSGLLLRAGLIPEVIQSLAKGLARSGYNVKSVWMTSHEGSEEKGDEDGVKLLCNDMNAQFKLFVDEKYFIDDRDTKLSSGMRNLPDVFTTYRKNQEPLRQKPRPVLPPPSKGDLPPFPEASAIPAQHEPFAIPETPEGLVEALIRPVRDFLPDMPPFPEDAESAHPLKGGETHAHERLKHLIRSGALSLYDTTRNGLLGTDFSTKLSGYLAQGCLTARQIHHSMACFEDGADATFENVEGYGKGENGGTKSIRFELLWRDYMRLCHTKYGDKLFRLAGLRSEYTDNTIKADVKAHGTSDDEANNTADATANGTANGIVNGTANGVANGATHGASNGTSNGIEIPKKKPEWKSPNKEHALENQNPDCRTIAEYLERFKAGTTGLGFIDASQRELLHTGYTSNRARQNVASFLAKHLCIDWRYGAEWYEMLLVDYDVSSNWANWQYVSGVGNDPRGDLRIFNPIKQAFDYDKNGDYVRAWVPEVRGLQRLENVFQACTASEEDREAAGLAKNIMATNPIHRISFDVENKPRSNRYNAHRGRRPRGARGGQGDHNPQPAGPGASNDAAGGVNTNASVTPAYHGDAPVVNGSPGAPRAPQPSGPSGYRTANANQRVPVRNGHYGRYRGSGNGNGFGNGPAGGGALRGGSGGSPQNNRGHGNQRGGFHSGRGRGGYNQSCPSGQLPRQSKNPTPEAT
ncbi:DASH family cryptochrome [Cladorrhinum sp. PSN332]|nr:DASH family cryptochrome [Cladorrhinum sp. PSN332]